MTTLLAVVPPFIAKLWTEPMANYAPWLKVVIHGQDEYKPEDIDYALGFRPPPGLFKTLPNLKAIFSLGAGVDGFLSDKDFPRHIPLVRFVDHTLSREMTHYVVLQTLMFHRTQRQFDRAQAQKQWAQMFPPRRTEDTRIGILGLGEIGTMAGEHLARLDFPVAGWSRTKKNVPGIKSFAGDGELEAFLGQSDILVCLLPLTPTTQHILNKKTFAQLPQGAFVINAARGGHLVEDDLIAAIEQRTSGRRHARRLRDGAVACNQPDLDASQDHGDAACRRHDRSARRLAHRRRCNRRSHERREARQSRRL